MNKQGWTVMSRSNGQARRDGTTGQAVVVVASPETVLRKVWAVGERIGPQPVRPLAVVQACAEISVRPRPELAFYRKYTEAMLRRYLRLSMETGRTPALLGRELFRARVSSYRVSSFEDVVVFCIDIERCIARLRSEEKSLLRRIALQEYTQGEAAALLGLSLRDTVRKYGAALDRLTGILLAAGLMNELKQ